MISSQSVKNDGTKKVPIDQKVTAKNALPFLKWAPWLLGLVIPICIFEPAIIKYGLFWPIVIGFSIVAGFLLYLRRTGRAYAEVSASFPIIGKFVSAIFILAVLGSIILLIQWAVLTYMVEGLGISSRYSYMMAIGASPFVLSGIWYVLKESLPGQPLAIFFGSLMIAMALIAVLIFINIQSPEGFVDHQNGETLKWYSSEEDRLYSSPGKDGYGNNLIPAVDALKDPETSSTLRALGNSDDQYYHWKFKVIHSDPNEVKKVDPKAHATAIVTRTATQLIIRIFKGTTENSIFNGTSTDGKTYSGIWAYVSGEDGKFTIEFVSEGSAIGTMTTQKDGVLTIDLRRWSVP